MVKKDKVDVHKRFEGDKNIPVGKKERLAAAYPSIKEGRISLDAMIKRSGPGYSWRQCTMMRPSDCNAYIWTRPRRRSLQRKKKEMVTHPIFP